MNFRHLFIQLLLLLTVMAVANVIVFRKARNALFRQILRKSEVEPATEIFLGNSLIAAGIDEVAFLAIDPNHRPLNLGLGATSPVEHSLIFKKRMKQQGTCVYYGYFDLQLTTPCECSWETLVGNRALPYYYELETALQYYDERSVFQTVAIRITAYIPALVERYTIWSKVERMRRFFNGLGMRQKESNRFGRSDDFEKLEMEPNDFAGQCQQAVTDRVPLSKPVAAIFQQAREQGYPITVVEMPMPLRHRKVYYERDEWKKYKEHIVELVTEAGGIYLSASEWVEDDGFIDHIHLGVSGARFFSTRLAEWAKSRN